MTVLHTPRNPPLDSVALARRLGEFLDGIADTIRRLRRLAQDISGQSEAVNAQTGTEAACEKPSQRSR